MALPRSKYVHEGEEGVYHCFSRCVRRAFLYGFDALTRRDFSHRKAWLVDRLQRLAGIFAVEVCAYAVMANHYHTVLRTRPDIAAGWSDREVATRWLRLFPRHCGMGGEMEEQIRALEHCPGRIATLRQRLCSLSWFMGRLNEYVARAANKEDKVKGRFWEARYKCQVLLDDAAIAACMVYVDLNPVRAGVAETLEGSEFTSIQERIRRWQMETMTPAAVCAKAAGDERSSTRGGDRLIPENAEEIPVSIFEGASADGGAHTACWLCPLSSEWDRRGILQMSAAEYFDLVDQSGRTIRSDKRGALEADIAPILLRIGANPEAWVGTVSGFGNQFHLVAGLVLHLRNFADELGRRWFKGAAAARAAFAPSPPQLAYTS
jgi:putative transposase